MSAAPGVVSMADVTPNRRRGGDIRVLLSPGTCGAVAGFGGIVILEPGEAVAEHYHPYSDEFVVVTAGNVRLRLDGRYVSLGPGEAVMISRGVRHRLEHDGTGQASVVFFSAPLAPRPDLGHVDTEPATAGALP